MAASPTAVRRRRHPPDHRTSAGWRPASADPAPAPDQRDGTRPGQLVVDRLPQLRAHLGTPPDLVLRWGAMPATATVDVVVHLHGHSPRGRQMNLVRDMEPVSGLDLADPARPDTTGRSTPTLLVLPRGHHYGGRTGRGYSFPELVRPGAVTALVDDALRRLAAATGVRARRGRLILTAHSGGGSALMAILRHLDPDEVHAFDALYGDPGPLIAWARRRRAAGSGALRVLFRPAEATAPHSLRVGDAIGAGSPRFRVEQTSVPHRDIPRTYGWRLLADAGADLPGAVEARRPRTAGHDVDRELPAPWYRPATTPVPLCVAIARVAAAQFRRWRPGGGAALTETSPGAVPILREYYRVGIGAQVTDRQLRDASYQAAHPWSAVFISYVMRTAGAGPAFAYSPAHQTYIRAARRNRLERRANPFWAFRASEVAPRVGDLVCASRLDGRATYDNIGDATARPTHCDVVTEVRPGRIRVVGGNVGQTVGEKWLRTLPDGRLSPAGAQSRIFAVIRCRSAAAPLGPPGPSRPWPPSPSRPPSRSRPPSAPAPPSTQAPPPSGSSAPAPAPARAAPVPPGAAGLEARAERVMDLLVNRYGYPVNGAAGLVGNLIAESGVQPDRLEGSDAETPMRAQDFAGRVRDFTPEEVRDRDAARGTGPRLPGVGLAQWTSRDRRVGLFRHTVGGRTLGPAILTDLDAQVDYLVSELRTGYRAVDAVLRAPGVTVDAACDEVLMNFERPAAVLNRSRTDPAIQPVLARRRTFAVRALRIHQSGGRR